MGDWGTVGGRRPIRWIDTGRWNGAPGYEFRVHAEDHGETGGI